MRILAGKAERLQKIKPSGIRRIFSLAQNIPDLINLGIGEPDFTPPKHILNAAQNAISEGKTHYSPSNGIPELREATAEKFTREYGLYYNPENEILVTVGATEAVALALLALVNQGDEVLIPDPGFVCYGPAVRIAGGIPVSIPINEDSDFKPDIDAVMSLITPKSRVIILNFPNNPTGAVLSYNELAKLAKLAVQNNLIVISDEVYEKIIYDDSKHYCLAALPDMRDRTIVINSFSKTYAMTGFRVGCALGPKDLISAMLLIHQFMVACVDGPAQYAATAALEGSQEFVTHMVSEFDKRRKLIHKRLNEIEGFQCSLPKGAFYVFPSVRNIEKPSTIIAEHILKKAKVVVTPGSSFGNYGEGHLRFSYAAAFEKIDEAVDRIGKIIRLNI